MHGIPLLAVEKLSKRFRGLHAVRAVSFTVTHGEIVALIGPNGAGKTTIFNIIAGAFRPDEGEVRLDGVGMVGLRPDQICGRGVGRTFQIVQPFPALTVEDNVVVGALMRTNGVNEARQAARGILERLGLAAKRDDRASTLTLPERKRLEVARALATRPKILLLDEVMAGLRPTEVDDMIALLQAMVTQTGLSILLIEHVMRAVMALAKRIVVLHHGEKLIEGAPDQVVRDPAVLESYLGGDTDL